MESNKPNNETSKYGGKVVDFQLFVLPSDVLWEEQKRAQAEYKKKKTQASLFEEKVDNEEDETETPELDDLPFWQLETIVINF